MFCKKDSSNRTMLLDQINPGVGQVLEGITKHNTKPCVGEPIINKRAYIDKDKYDDNQSMVFVALIKTKMKKIAYSYQDIFEMASLARALNTQIPYLPRGLSVFQLG